MARKKKKKSPAKKATKKSKPVKRSKAARKLTLEDIHLTLKGIEFRLDQLIKSPKAAADVVLSVAPPKDDSAESDPSFQ